MNVPVEIKHMIFDSNVWNTDIKSQVKGKSGEQRDDFTEATVFPRFDTSIGSKWKSKEAGPGEI